MFMKKFLLLDADGVAIVPREKYFSARYAEDFGVSLDLILPFFKNEFNDCLTGKKELRQVFQEQNILEKWKWTGTIDELLEYWWKGENKRFEEVLSIVKTLRSEGTKCYLATDQEKNRADYIWDTMGMSRDFDGKFISCDMGVRKTNTEYWTKVLERLGNPDPSEVEFWDDDKENVEVAIGFGIDAHFFTTVEEFNISVQ